MLNNLFTLDLEDKPNVQTCILFDPGCRRVESENIRHTVFDIMFIMGNEKFKNDEFAKPI